MSPSGQSRACSGSDLAAGSHDIITYVGAGQCFLYIDYATDASSSPGCYDPSQVASVVYPTTANGVNVEPPPSDGFGMRIDIEPSGSTETYGVTFTHMDGTVKTTSVNIEVKTSPGVCDVDADGFEDHLIVTEALNVYTTFMSFDFADECMYEVVSLVYTNGTSLDDGDSPFLQSIENQYD